MLIQFLKFWATFSRREDIKGHGVGEDTYLVRFHLINCRWFKLYLHYFLRSDLDDPHDHPWDFWTLMLRGEYDEYLFSNSLESRNPLQLPFALTQVLSRSVKHLRLIKRNAEDIHRIVLKKQYNLSEMNQAPMTLFFAFKKRKEWGFFHEGVWIRWEEYLKMPKTLKENR